MHAMQLKKIAVILILFLGSFGTAQAFSYEVVNHSPNCGIYIDQNLSDFYGGGTAIFAVYINGNGFGVNPEKTYIPTAIGCTTRDPNYTQQDSILGPLQGGNTGFSFHFTDQNNSVYPPGISYNVDSFTSSMLSILGAPIGIGSLESAVGITTTNIIGWASVPIALGVVFWLIGLIIGMFPEVPNRKVAREMARSDRLIKEAKRLRGE